MKSKGFFLAMTSKLFILVVAVVLWLSGPANATLWDRGGGMIYDDVLNITWLQDANYAYTSGYDDDGKMTWDEAVAWTDQLVYGGYDDWRLPQVKPVNGAKYNLTWVDDGSADLGYNITAPISAFPGSTASEMAYMFYNNLGNLGQYDVNGNPNPDFGLQNVSFVDGNGKTVSFQNIIHYPYWSGTKASEAWAYHFYCSDGTQRYNWLNRPYYAWAVRDGDVSVPSDNQAPVARTGNNQSVKHGTVVTLDASGSYDPDENYPLIYHWEILAKPAGSSAQLSDPNSMNPTFTPDLPGGYRIQLIVTDSLGLSNEPSDSREIAFQPGPLDGMDVWVTYPYYGYGLDTWYLIVGGWGNEYYSLINFDVDALPANVSSAKIHLFCYAESDFLVRMHMDRIDSFWDESTKWFNRPSFTNFDTLSAPSVGQWYPIDITDLYNAWRSTSYPNYGIQLRPIFESPGDHINVFYSSDYLDVTSLRPKLVVQYSGHPQVLISAYNTPPVAHAGLDQSVIEIGAIVSLDGTQSWDDDGDSITYSWAIVQKPEGSQATLDSSVSATPAFVADVHGEYRLSLEVSDPWATSVPDEIVVSFENVQPVAVAGANQALILGQVASLDGSGSHDANHDQLSFRWSIVTKPTGNNTELSDPFTFAPYFLPDLAGEYIVSLIVNDGFVDSEASNVTVMVITKQDAVSQELQDSVEVINSVDQILMNNPNNINALTNKIIAALALIDQGLYLQALNKLENDILKKTNGCAELGHPDKNDWIKDCESQNSIYPTILDAIDLLRSLL